MKPKNFRWAILLLVILGLALWRFSRPTATAPENSVQAPPLTPTQVKDDTSKLTIPAAQVELPKAPVVPAKGTAAALGDNTDPQADLTTAIRDIVRLGEAGDYVGIYKVYTPPDKMDPKTIKDMQATKEKELKLEAEIPGFAAQLKDESDSQARAYEALESQTPIYNATGDEATYQQFAIIDSSSGKTYSQPLSFIKINGKWYIKPAEGVIVEHYTGGRRP